MQANTGKGDCTGKNQKELMICPYAVKINPLVIVSIKSGNLAISQFFGQFRKANHFAVFIMQGRYQDASPEY